MEQKQREARVLMLLAGLVAAGAVIGVLIDRISEGNQTRPAAVVVPAPRRVIPWSAAKATSSATASVNWPTLVAGISAPPSISAGGTLRYRVTLRNNGGALVLQPCPHFEQSLTPLAGTGSISSQFLVDCASIGALRPEEEVVLEMRIDIPRSFGAGPVNLFWKMDGGVDTLTTLEVLAAS